MNIFYLDHDPEKAAQLMCDQHINKMILESAQLLSTCVSVMYGNEPKPHLYKPTHVNHPCSVWLRESHSNCEWLYNHCRQLNNERFHRFDSTQDHMAMMVAATAMHWLDGYRDNQKWYENGMTEPDQAMPAACQFPESAPIAYQNYYNHKNKMWIDNKRLAGTGPGAMKWSNRPRPSFMFT